MRKFVRLAINYQDNADTPEEAVRLFETSCEICSSKGLITQDCDKCPIQVHHKLIMAIFDDLKSYNESSKQELTKYDQKKQK